MNGIFTISSVQSSCVTTAMLQSPPDIFIRTPPGVRKLLARNEHSNFRTEGGVLPNQLQKMGGKKK